VVAEGEGYIQLAGGHGFGQLIPDAIPLNRVANSLGLSGLFMRDELQPFIALDRSDPRYNSPHQLSLPVSSEPQESVIAIKLSTGLGDVTFQVLDLEPVTISLIRGDTLYCSGSALRYLFLDAGSFLRSEFEVKFLWFDRKPNGGVEHKG